MKLNWSFLNQTLLSLTLLTSATLPTQAQMLTKLSAESNSLSNLSTVSAVNHLDLVVDRSNIKEGIFVSAALDHRYNSQTEVNAQNDNSSVTPLIVAAADASAENSNAENPDQGFLAKKTAKIEFIFALMIIIASLIVSERFQRLKEQQQSTTDETKGSIAKNTIEQKPSIEK